MQIYSIPVFILMAISLDTMYKKQNLKKLVTFLIAISMIQFSYIYLSVPEEEADSLMGSSYILDDTVDLSLYASENLNGFYISNSKEGVQVSTINPARIKIAYMYEKPLLLSRPSSIEDFFTEYKWDTAEDVGVSSYEISTTIWKRPLNHPENKNLFQNFKVNYAIINLNYPNSVKSETSIRFIEGDAEQTEQSPLLDDINRDYFNIYINDLNKVSHF